MCDPVSVWYSEKLCSPVPWGFQLLCWTGHEKTMCHTQSREEEGLILRLAVKLSQLLTSGRNSFQKVQFFLWGLWFWGDGAPPPVAHPKVHSGSIEAVKNSIWTWISIARCFYETFLGAFYLLSRLQHHREIVRYSE